MSGAGTRQLDTEKAPKTQARTITGVDGELDLRAVDAEHRRVEPVHVPGAVPDELHETESPEQFEFLAGRTGQLAKSFRELRDAERSRGELRDDVPALVAIELVQKV